MRNVNSPLRTIRVPRPLQSTSRSVSIIRTSATRTGAEEWTHRTNICCPIVARRSCFSNMTATPPASAPAAIACQRRVFLRTSIRCACSLSARRGFDRRRSPAATTDTAREWYEVLAARTELSPDEGMESEVVRPVVEGDCEGDGGGKSMGRALSRNL